MLHPFEDGHDPLADVVTGDVADNGIALLTGTATAAVRRRAQMLLDSSTRILSAGFPELLAHLGIDPQGMLALALALPNDLVTAVRGAGDRIRAT